MSLTQRDLDEIEKLIDEKLSEAFKHLPTKDEFYKQWSDIMGELKAIREGQDIIVGRDYLERLEKLENIHPDYKHQATL